MSPARRSGTARTEFAVVRTVLLNAYGNAVEVIRPKADRIVSRLAQTAHYVRQRNDPRTPHHGISLFGPAVKRWGSGAGGLRTLGDRKPDPRARKLSVCV